MQDRTIRNSAVLLRDHSKSKHVWGIFLLGSLVAFFDIAFVATLKEYIGFFTSDDSYFKTEYPLSVSELTIFTGMIILLSFSLKIMNLFLVFVFSEKIRSSLSVSLLKSIVSSSSRNIESFGLNYYKKLVVNEVDRFSEKTIAPLINAAVQMVVIVGLFTYLLYLNYVLAISIILVVVTFYVTISYLLQNILKKFSQQRLNSLNRRLDTIDTLIELNDEIKEKKTLDVYLAQYYDENLFYSKIMVQNNTFGACPRYLLECFIFLTIVFTLFMLQLKLSGGSFVSYIPLISAFILAFYKMLPGAQLLYNAFVLIQSNADLIQKLSEHLKPINDKVQKYSFSEIRLLNKCSDLNIRYNGVLTDFNVVHGKSGIGKSTLLYEFYKDLESKKAFVKQSISLIDGNIYENIRLGDDKIHDDEIEKYLHIFQLGDIERFKNLKILNDTISGGQKQRIGIIRALISKPNILFLDETLSGINSELKFSILKYLQSSDVGQIFIISHDRDIIDSFNSLEVTV